MLALPSVMAMSDDVKKIYAAEAAALGVYVALTEHPTAVKPLIPFSIHGKIDPFNVALFLLQTSLPPFGKIEKREPSTSFLRFLRQLRFY